MNGFDAALIAASALLTGWCVRGLAGLEAAGRRWPLVRRWLLTALGGGAFLVGLLCLSWANTYDRLPPWPSFIVDPCLAAAWAAVVVFRQERRARVHAPGRPF